MSIGSVSSPASRSPWRAPLVVVICSCLIGLLSFGPRSAFGFFLQPMSRDFSWGRDVFAFAFAFQNLLWGIGQPVAGALADRFGAVRVIAGGSLLYALGLGLMRYSSAPLVLDITAGVLIGFALAGCSFNVILAALGKIVPERWRAVSFGAVTAASSFGQFVFAPLGVILIGSYGWQMALTVFAGLMLLIVPLSLALRTPVQSSSKAAPDLSLRAALAQAFSHRSYVLLVLGFFTCGFQLAFITAHLPAYLVDRGLDVQVGAWTIAAIGLFNIVGSLGVGWLAGVMPKRFILSTIYAVRALATVAFISFPITPFTAIAFGVVSGLAWLSTVPPTSQLVALMFGTRWLAMLYGFAFFSHQVGGFLGVWLGALVFERTGSYNGLWWLSVFFGVASALINLPIVEKPVQRPLVQPA